MNDSILVPGKIFLMGEYSVVQGGKALVAALNPAYAYRVAGKEGSRDPSAKTISLHPESPAGKYLSEHAGAPMAEKSAPIKFDQLKIEQLNSGLSAGFGTSTAELIAVASTPASEKLNRADLWRWYQQQFPKASGADLAVQLEAMATGQAVFEVSEKNSIRPLSVLPGGGNPSLYGNIFIYQNSPDQKLATHVDLKKDFVYLNTDIANTFHERLIAALTENSLASLTVLSDWAEWLSKLGLETKLAQEIRSEFSKVAGVVAAKGCGAGLHDVFLVVVKDAHVSHVEKLLHDIAQKYQLRFLGSLADRLWNAEQAFAPVNIAWVKYMGKTEGAPANASLSMTLDHLGTQTKITATRSSSHQKIIWDESAYVPPAIGKTKVENFLFDRTLWIEPLKSLGFTANFPESVLISTRNNVPAGTGIATSASAFAALTMAWAGVLVGDKKREFRKKLTQDETAKKVLAQISKNGSGSACRSFLGPWVEWIPESGIKRVESGKESWIDFILLLEEKNKKISSSEAHTRVKTSPQWSGRTKRATARLGQVKEALRQDQFSILKTLVLEEALDMHDLFHTSEPAFSYWNEESERWIGKAKNNDPLLPSPNAVTTLDAGANVHWFVPAKEENIWRKYFSDQQVKFLVAAAGEGARFTHEDFRI